MGYAKISPIRRPPASPEPRDPPASPEGEADGGQVAGRLPVSDFVDFVLCRESLHLGRPRIGHIAQRIARASGKQCLISSSN